MDRRKFIAVGVTALIAGCDSQNTDDTDAPTDGETPGGADGTDGGGDDTPGGDTSTPTEDGTITPGGDFDATITFQSCTEFTVEAEEYTHVFVAVAGGTVDSFEEGYSGEESFEASGPINSVTVHGEGGSYEAPNPDAGECREQAEE
jgi:hypothetical protein